MIPHAILQFLLVIPLITANVPGLSPIRTQPVSEGPRIAIIFPESSDYYDYDVDYSEFDNTTIHLLNDLNEPTIEEQLKLSEAHTLEEYAKLLDFDLSIIDPIITTRVRVPGGEKAKLAPKITTKSGGKKPIKAKSAKCKPSLTPVELDLPKEPKTVYLPKCVELHRCGGCCGGSDLECQPTTQEEISLEILKIKTDEKSKRRSSIRRGRRRRRRGQSVDLEIVRESNHTSCSCQCRVKEEHCNPSIHVYSQSQCKCLCKTKDEAKKCQKKNETHLWDSEKCECLCRDAHECSSSQYYDHKKCRCETPILAVRTRTPELPSEKEYRASHFQNYREPPRSLNILRTLVIPRRIG